MKRLSLLIISIAAMLITSIAADAQFRFGIKAGTAINSIKFNSLNTTFDSDNRSGFTGGIMAEAGVPILGLCLDASVLYTQRENDFPVDDSGTVITNKREYIDVPVNIKYKLSLPLIASIIKPFVATGPDFAFLMSKKAVEDAIENKSVDIAWNFGFGLELFTHLQVQASYGVGLSEATTNSAFNTKNRTWTVTAAYLF